jgi:hypothetical protein
VNHRPQQHEVGLVLDETLSVSRRVGEGDKLIGDAISGLSA